MHDRSELDCKLEGLKFIAISPSSIVDFFGLDGMLLRSVALLGPSSIVDFFGLGLLFLIFVSCIHQIKKGLKFTKYLQYVRKMIEKWDKQPSD